jgi:hypothetical protein
MGNGDGFKKHAGQQFQGVLAGRRGALREQPGGHIRPVQM